MTILTQVCNNSPMVSNYFNSWALALSMLIWANLAGLLAQVDIPQEVWGQYPLILIGALLAGWVFRYWVQNEREWREFTTRQVAEKENSNLRTLQLIQTNNEQWLKILGDNHKEQIAVIEKNHKEQLELHDERQRETFDAALERILESRYDNQPTRRDYEHRG